MKKSNDTSTILLDKMRAGLLDGRPDLKTRVQRSLAEDPLLQDQDRMFRRTLDVLDNMADQSPVITNQLRVRRRAVMSGAARRAAPLRMPGIALGTAVSMLSALAIGWLWLTNDADDINPQASVLDREEITDLTDNLDFYNWLDHRANISGKSGNGT